MTTNALTWIRKSKGSDDDIGLEEQREKVLALAEEVADDYEKLDLGIQTGFSTMSRDDTGLLDQHPEVQDAVDDLEAGRYDYIVALDDRRICRDEYLSIIEYAATQGDCEFVYVGDVQEDDLAYDIHRRVERETKEEEIRKAKSAIRRRKEKGYYQGRPPFGTKFDEDGHHLEKDPEEWEELRTIFAKLEAGTPYREIEADTSVSKATISHIKNRGREFYEEYGDLAVYHEPS